MLVAEAVNIWRDPDGDYHVEWQVSAPDTEVTIEAHDAPEGMRLEADHAASRGRISGLAPGRRHYFTVSDQHGNRVVASERRFGMHGAPNFRDFGGYATQDGHRVKWGYLFRSGQLSNLSDHDLELLHSLELDLVFDFRRIEEQEGDPSRLPGERKPRVSSLPIVPGSNARFFEEADGHLAEAQAMVDFMREINSDFAIAQTGMYARMFREILEVPDARFLVHCAAGKDRTGFAAAIVLLALGVSRDVVMQDYLLTRRFFLPDREIARLQKKYAMEHFDVDIIRPMLEVHEDYLAEAFAAIDREYPSIEDYLREALQVGPDAVRELRRRYLD